MTDFILDDVVEEHAEEASFRWDQRDYAVHAPDFDLSDILEWDAHVVANLDGLRIAGERGWEICKDLGWELAGEYFTAMSLAIIHGQSEYIDEVLGAAEGDPSATRGVISAFGWADPRGLRGLVKRLLEQTTPFHQQVAIAACAVHRVNPGPSLVQALNDTHAGLRARALKACGELGLVDLLPHVESHLEDDDDECRMRAAWAAGMLGSRRAVDILALFASVDNPHRRQALSLVLRLMEPEQAKQWLRTLARDKSQMRWALIGAGIQGDPSYLQPLMQQFSDEGMARVAGEAFEMITGLNMFYQSLEVIPDAPEPPPETSDKDEAEDDDDEEDLGEDYGLVIPDLVKMEAWFAKNGSQFQPGQRYLCGAPVTPESCASVLRNGRQRQRQAAAMELALAKPGSHLFETRAPASRQLHNLGS